MSTKPRIKLPDNIKVGDIIEIKTLITHIMETGQRRDKDGKPIARSILNAFRATFGGQDVFAADMQPGISANPYLSFYFKVPGPGTFVFTWVEDGGRTIQESVPLTIS